MKHVLYVIGVLVLIPIFMGLSPLILIAALVALGIGLNKPHWVVKTKDYSKRTKATVIKWYGSISIVALISIMVIMSIDTSGAQVEGTEPTGQEYQGETFSEQKETVEEKEEYKSQEVTTQDVENMREEVESQESIPQVEPEEKLEVHFIDVGQGDAIFIDYGDFDMLIDAGDNKYGDTVVNYLKQEEVDGLEYVVGTHMDADHIGGLDVVLNHFEVENIIDSGTSKDTQTYRDYHTAIKAEGANYQEDTTMTITVDQALSFKIIETGDSYSDENDNSVVVWLTYLDKDFLFTGDMESHAEQAALSDIGDIDVLKSGHHGSRTSSTEAFLNKVDAEYVVISCGKDNKYGHPHQETLDKYEARGMEVFRTDLQGSVIATVDREGNITWNAKPTKYVKPSNNSNSSNNSSSSNSSSNIGSTNSAVDHTTPKFEGKTEAAYVGSVQSDKYHYPTCSSAKKINASNLVEFTSKQDANNKGYVPCGRCKP